MKATLIGWIPGNHEYPQRVIFHHGEEEEWFGRILGAITGSPYERLEKQIDKVVAEAGNLIAPNKNSQEIVKRNW